MGFQVTEKDGSGRDSAVYSVDVTQLVNGNGAHAQAESVPRTRSRAYVKVCYRRIILGPSTYVLVCRIRAGATGRPCNGHKS